MTNPQDPQSIEPTEPTEEKSKYNKRIEEIIEDAEIEAELEAEQKIRSKHTKLVTISIVGVLLLVSLYWFMNLGSDPDPAPEPRLANEPQLGTTANMDGPLPPLKEPEPKSSGAIPTPEAPRTIPDVQDIPQKPKIVEQSDPIVPPKASTPRPQPASRQPRILEPTPAPPAPSRSVRRSTPPRDIRPSVSVPSTPVTRAPGSYTVQLGAFTVKANAQALYSKLQKNNVEPSMRVRPGSNTLYEVSVGLFLDEAGGQRQRDDLIAAGFNPKLVKNADRTYKFVVGTPSSKREADRLQDDLSIKGFLSTVKKKSGGRTFYIVHVGQFSSREEAHLTQQQLATLGFKNSFIYKN